MHETTQGDTMHPDSTAPFSTKASDNQSALSSSKRHCLSCSSDERTDTRLVLPPRGVVIPPTPPTSSTPLTPPTPPFPPTPSVVHVTDAPVAADERHGPTPIRLIHADVPDSIELQFAVVYDAICKMACDGGRVARGAALHRTVVLGEQSVLGQESVLQLALRELRQSYRASREFLLQLVPEPVALDAAAAD